MEYFFQVFSVVCMLLLVAAICVLIAERVRVRKAGGTNSLGPQSSACRETVHNSAYLPRLQRDPAMATPSTRSGGLTTAQPGTSLPAPGPSRSRSAAPETVFVVEWGNGGRLFSDTFFSHTAATNFRGKVNGGLITYGRMNLEPITDVGINPRRKKPDATR